VSNLAAFRRGWVTLSQDFRGRGRPWWIFVSFHKTRHILLSDSASCTVLRHYVPSFWHKTLWQTDRQTDGIAVASTALAMRALRRAVKTTHNLYIMLTAMCKLQKSPSMCCWLVSYSQGRNHVFKVGGPIFCQCLGYCTEENTDGIPSFVDCSLLRNGVITLFIKKVGVVRPNFGGSGSPPTLQWLRPWS